jgi:hypothetical protein
VHFFAARQRADADLARLKYPASNLNRARHIARATGEGIQRGVFVLGIVEKRCATRPKAPPPVSPPPSKDAKTAANDR